MTYPPGSPGYPPAQQGNQYIAPTQQFGKVGEPEQTGPSKLPAYLSAAVAAFGLGTYVFNFGPLLTISNSDFPQFGSASGSTPGLGLAVAASVLAALLAGIGLLPKQKTRAGLVAVVATLSFLLVLSEVINAPTGLSIGWGLYLIIATTLFQAGAAIAALLFDAEVLTPPAPKPRYEQPYGQYGQPPYGYGQPQGQPQQYGQPQQRPGYPTPYGSYPGGPSTGGFSGAGSAGSYSDANTDSHAAGGHSGPPTPPTGFPAFGQPQQQGSSAPTSAVPTQSPTPPAQSDSTPQSGPPSS
ncbi:DUF5336 domain-containing protein [Mycolicibacterium neoaurum]|uniref:DUF5336 domain-containing protein n=1 Tax=Mycolicibacterium neoaurum TaxID=1795 RepID=UPI00248BB11E|nr:DUF5336 domain-containing protein [Mycolicibacterium neoaurum]MDO3400918.1 DUF5336 domain-containing protein [Mycolicibacterium neoaurum]WBP95057.1 DUF5336 domain-containing protein [Mycolicibacterium neoaurum]WBS08645.1 DUF5336 domain-containing protein [Mycolicibacterium neoaurum]